MNNSALYIWIAHDEKDFTDWKKEHLNNNHLWFGGTNDVIVIHYKITW